MTRATSITRRRRGTASRQRLLGVLAITLLATCLFILLLLALNTTRECVQESRKYHLYLDNVQLYGNSDYDISIMIFYNIAHFTIPK